MKKLGEWIRRRFQANVEGGTGVWSTAPDDPTLGEAIYDYDDDQISVTLYDEGFTYTRAGVQQRWLYSEVDEVVVMPLTELVKVHRKPQETVKLGLKCAGEEHALRIPMELYSELAPTLCGAVENRAREEGEAIR